MVETLATLQKRSNTLLTVRHWQAMPTLGRYLSAIYEWEFENGKPTQNRKIRFKQNPKLDCTRTNVILVYRGSFNPPHRGHLAVLCHAYMQLSKELNIVAAIIRPSADAVVRRKCSSRRKRFFCSTGRARLWKEDPHFPPWAWVFDDYDSGCAELQTKLQALARRDKCRLRFAKLWGPDCGEDQVLDSYDDMTIVSDVAREVSSCQRDWLENFRPSIFGAWVVDDRSQREEVRAQQAQEAIQWQRRVCAGKVRARRAIDEKYNSVPVLSANLSQVASDLAIAKIDGLLAINEPEQLTPPEARETLTAQIARLGSPCSVHVCWHGTRKSLRFLQATSQQHASFRGISSTEIQTKIHELKGYKLKSALESLALSPGLLWDMLLPNQLQRHDLEKVKASLRAIDPPIHRDFIKSSIGNLNAWAFGRGVETLDDIVLPAKELNIEHRISLVLKPTVLGKRRRDSSSAMDESLSPTKNANTVASLFQRKRRSSLPSKSQYTKVLPVSFKTSVVACYECFHNTVVDVSTRDRKKQKLER